MSTHTPGPWTYQEQAGRYFINGAVYYNLAVTSNEANARLIAAAPALLEALEALLETTEMNMDDMEPHTLAEIDKARAAIAQAKGAK